MQTLDVPLKSERRRKLLSQGLTLEQLWNMPILVFFAFNGVIHASPGIQKFVSAVATVGFGIAVLLPIARNRLHVRWELWTCRIAALITVDVVFSVLWDVQPILTTVYPCLVIILTFFYVNYLLDHFPPNSVTRMMLWTFGILLALTIVFSIAVPSIGIDNGSDDPNNAGAWQGIFAQKNQLGMATVFAVAVALGIRPKGQMDRLWRGFVLFAALLCAAGSRSREAWGAIAMELAAAVFLTGLRKFRLRSQLPLLLGGTLVAAFVGMLMSTTYLDPLLALVGRSRTASGRTDIWEGSFLLIHRRPWLGYGVYGVWHTPVAWEVVARAGWNVPSSHNNYIEILLYYGIVGLTIYLLLVLVFFIWSFRAFLVGRFDEIEPGVYILIGVLMLSVASPITVYFPSVAFLLMIFYFASIERIRTPVSIPSVRTDRTIQPQVLGPA
jgi:O-antigen ligase